MLNILLKHKYIILFLFAVVVLVLVGWGVSYAQKAPAQPQDEIEQAVAKAEESAAAAPDKPVAAEEHATQASGQPVAAPVAAATPEPSTVGQSPETAAAKEGLVRAGRAYYDWKDYKSAIKKWEEAQAIDPGDKTVASYIEHAKQRLQAQKKPEAAPAAASAAASSGVQYPKADIPSVRAVSPETIAQQLPQDLTKKKAFFNFNKQKKDKPRVNAGRQWFNWFKKETNTPEVSPGQVLSLDECVQIAIRNNISLQVAGDSLKLSELRVNEAQRNMLPTATVAYEQYTGEINGRQYDGRKQYIEGQQPVFRGGELWYTVKQAKTNVEITKCDFDKIRNELILQVKKAYYTLGKSQENLNLQRDLRKEVDAICERVKKEAEFNVTSRIELLNVNSQAAQVYHQLVAAEGDVSIAELILKQAMNLDPQEAVRVAPKLEFKKVEVNYEEALKTGFANRPEVKMDMLLLEYYDYGKRIAKAKFWPKIDILGSWGLAKEQYCAQDRLGPSATGFDCDRKLEQQWYASAKASMPFWGSTGEYSWTREQWVPVVSAYQGTEATTHSMKLKILDRLDIYSDRQTAELEYDKARQELNKIKQDVALEVKQECFNYAKALIQLDVSTKKVTYQTSDLELTKFKRGLDEVPDSNLVDSMVKLAQERFGYVQALSDCHIGIASINKAIGVDNYYKDDAEVSTGK